MRFFSLHKPDSSASSICHVLKRNTNMLYSIITIYSALLMLQKCNSSCCISRVQSYGWMIGSMTVASLPGTDRYFLYPHFCTSHFFFFATLNPFLTCWNTFPSSNNHLPSRWLRSGVQGAPWDTFPICVYSSLTVNHADVTGNTCRGRL